MTFIASEMNGLFSSIHGRQQIKTGSLYSWTGSWIDWYCSTRMSLNASINGIDRYLGYILLINNISPSSLLGNIALYEASIYPHALRLNPYPCRGRVFRENSSMVKNFFNYRQFPQVSTHADRFHALAACPSPNRIGHRLVDWQVGGPDPSAHVFFAEVKNICYRVLRRFASSSFACFVISMGCWFCCSISSFSDLTKFHTKQQPRITGLTGSPQGLQRLESLESWYL